MSDNPDDRNYNGWSNYETWSVSLIIDNDEGLASMRDEYAQSAWKDCSGNLNDKIAVLADNLENWITDSEFTEAFGMQSYGTPTLGGQLLGAALSEVNWREIAEHYIADVDKE